MKMKLIDKGIQAEILIEGRLDANSSPEAEKILLKLAEKYEIITLNISDMEYISSAGLRTIKLTHTEMKKKSGKLILKNANPKVMEVFEVTGFASILNFS